MQAVVLSMESTPEGIFLLPSNGKRLLVRSLSDGAKYGSSSIRRSALEEPDSDTSTCSCGCEDIPSLHEIEVDSSGSEDEGYDKGESEPPKSVVYVDSAERRSFSSSVDSGRSSDSGSLDKKIPPVVEKIDNRVSVFVPYTYSGSSTNSPTIEEEKPESNVFISDTRVRLQIGFEDEDDEKSILEPEAQETCQKKKSRRRRKDLCKLLGLSEESRRLALSHLSPEQQQEEEAAIRRRKKNLVKFLGVKDEIPIPFEDFKFSSKDYARSFRAKIFKGFFKPNNRSRSQESRDDEEQNGTISSVSSTRSRTPNANSPDKRRKDLNKFLGLDDSDSEEIIFIQNKRKEPLVKPQEESASSPKRKGILLSKKHSPLPHRKSVIFREYDFSVEESLARGLPVIPFGDSPTNSKERKKKKDADRRSKEIRHNSERSLDTLLRVAQEEWRREKSLLVKKPRDDAPSGKVVRFDNTAGKQRLKRPSALKLLFSTDGASNNHIKRNFN